MRTIKLTIAVIPILFLCLTANNATAFQLACGIEPPTIKPIVVGCKDMVHRCACDEHGKNCKWVWVCVK
jgi:hypothetical protein